MPALLITLFLFYAILWLAVYVIFPIIGRSIVLLCQLVMFLKHRWEGPPR
jgi:hypothetical protein